MKTANDVYAWSKQVRLTKRQAELLKLKAIEENASASEIIRQAVMSYVNRDLSDAEIVHATICENTRKIKYLEDKIELLAIIIFQEVKTIIKKLPHGNNAPQAIAENEFERFIRECMKTLKESGGGMLENMVLDLYEQSAGDNG